MADLLNVGIWQGYLSSASVGSALVRPYEEMCHTKARTRSIAKKQAGKWQGKRPPNYPLALLEPLAGQHWAVWGVERFSLACHRAWPKGVWLPVSSGTWGCRKWNLVQSGTKGEVTPSVEITVPVERFREVLQAAWWAVPKFRTS